MHRLLLALAALLLAGGPASAQRQPEWRIATEVDVLLHPYRYEPREIRLVAGRPIKLRFVNNGRANLSFRAPEFFRAAQVRRRDGRGLGGGGFRLAPGERRTIALVPARGRYTARSAFLLHRLRGMTATIIVE
jgi:hypothetical protein